MNSVEEKNEEITLPTPYQQFIHVSRYSRWIEDKKRRETWTETVDRYINFMCDEQCPGIVDDNTKNELKNAILNLEVMPSMRAMMSAGKALKRDNIAGFNCSYLPVDCPSAFDEAMFILMCGTGLGFSVERQFVSQLPIIAECFYPTETIICVPDSKIGWASSFKQLISLLYTGLIPKIDYSKLRPAGARLKTFGGRSSGPEPLRNLFEFTINMFINASGRKLSSIECHDLMCKIAEIVVVGGVRRSALISLSNLSDLRMRECKMGQWWENDVQRALANNSVAYTEKPEIGIFMQEWLALYQSKSGERGIYNRQACIKKAEETGRRTTKVGDIEYQYGVNPCCEIILRPNEFCNLSEVIVRENDNEESLKRKIKIATIIGTLQSTLTNFRYIKKAWKINCEEERLLGVSMTGIMDNKLMSNYRDPKLPELLKNLRQYAVDVNKEWAKKLNINSSASITCNKPSGTVSQLCNTASGLHARFSKYYIRNVRADNKDPLTQFMKNIGVPNEPDVTKSDSVTIFSFPVKSPDGCITRNDMSAIEQLELWKMYRTHFCDHNPSVTITVCENEWLDVGAWVYKNFDDVGGVSFLPKDNHVYRQPPFQECDEKTYLELLNNMPKNMDFSKLKDFEKEDNTTGTQEFACVGSSCELIDITKN